MPAAFATRKYFSREATVHPVGTQKSASAPRRATFCKKYSKSAAARFSETISPSHTGKVTFVKSAVLPNRRFASFPNARTSPVCFCSVTQVASESTIP